MKIIYPNLVLECLQQDSGKISFYVIPWPGSKQVLWSSQGLKVVWKERHIKTVCYWVGDNAGGFVLEDRRDSGECLL